MPSLRANSQHSGIPSWAPAVVLIAAVALPVSAAHAQSVSPAASAAQAAPAAAPDHGKPASEPPPFAAATTPARITMTNGELTVKAQNSDLAATLQQIARSSGMSIEGLGRTTRVFGDYGPASPRDVLTDLLAGSGYNFVMVGSSASGAPAKLVLSEKSMGPVAQANTSPAAADDSDAADNNEADQEPLGPGAIPHPSPQMTDDSDEQTRAERNLQRLQQMHQQMMQQQEQQQQSNPQ
ncbi:MAG TPA: hypothetical protein VME68_14210 [Acidobacteriaceae bacterium]|nr:hypothetical protein [Acidobacteriaceae bacterium]